MRRITAAIMGTITGLVLLFSYRTSTQPVAAATDEPEDTGAPPSGSTPGTTVTPTTTPSTQTASPDPASTSGTFTGDSVMTRFGPVQVEITVAEGQLTDVQAIDYPDTDHHDQRINAYAIPILNEEALQAQSARIDAVSGATVTSDAYIESLQSALDAAHR